MVMTYLVLKVRMLHSTRSELTQVMHYIEVTIPAIQTLIFSIRIHYEIPEDCDSHITMSPSFPNNELIPDLI